MCRRYNWKLPERRILLRHHEKIANCGDSLPEWKIQCISTRRENTHCLPLKFKIPDETSDNPNIDDDGDR